MQESVCKQVGETVGANVDPSRLMRMGAGAIAAIEFDPGWPTAGHERAFMAFWGRGRGQEIVEPAGPHHSTTTARQSRKAARASPTTLSAAPGSGSSRSINGQNEPVVDALGCPQEGPVGPPHAPIRSERLQQRLHERPRIFPGISLVEHFTKPEILTKYRPLDARSSNAEIRAGSGQRLGVGRPQ